MNYDFRLVHLIRKNDIKAFEELFRNYYLSLCRYAQCIVGRREVAEEIIGDLFYTLWQDRTNLNIFLSIKSYLYASTKNRCIDYIRQIQRNEEYLNDMQKSIYISSPVTPDEETENKELQAILHSCLSKMPERCKRIFQMHREKGLKYSEIASMLGISVKTVESDMSKTLKALRKEVESYLK